MKTTPSIYYSNKPRWRDLKVFIEDDMTEAILKATKKANKKYCYFKHKGIHQAPKEVLINDISKEVDLLEDVALLDTNDRTIKITFENTLTSIINISNRRKFSENNLVLEDIQKLKSSLLEDVNSSKVGYISFMMVQKTFHKKNFKKRVSEYIKDIKMDVKDLNVFDFTKCFKYYTRDDKSYKKIFKGYYISVVLKIQLK